MFVHRHNADTIQFEEVMGAVKASPDLIALGKDGRGDDRFTSRAMIETEQRLERATATLEARRNHGVADRYRELALGRAEARSEEHTSELQSLMRISYAVFCLKKKKQS